MERFLLVYAIGVFVLINLAFLTLAIFLICAFIGAENG